MRGSARTVRCVCVRVRARTGGRLEGGIEPSPVIFFPSWHKFRSPSSLLSSDRFRESAGSSRSSFEKQFHRCRSSFLFSSFLPGKKITSFEAFRTKLGRTRQNFRPTLLDDLDDQIKPPACIHLMKSESGWLIRKVLDETKADSE